MDFSRVSERAEERIGQAWGYETEGRLMLDQKE